MSDTELRELERVANTHPEDEDAQARHHAARLRAGYVARRLWFTGKAKRGRLTHCCAPEQGGPPPEGVCGQALDPETVEADDWRTVTCNRCQSAVFYDWSGRWVPHERVAYAAGVSLVRWERGA